MESNNSVNIQKKMTNELRGVRSTGYALQINLAGSLEHLSSGRLLCTRTIR